MPAALQAALAYPSHDGVAPGEKNTMQVPDRNPNCRRNLLRIKRGFRKMCFDELFNSCLVLGVAT